MDELEKTGMEGAGKAAEGAEIKTGEEQTPPAPGEERVEDAGTDGDDDVFRAEVEKRGYRNVIEENKRKAEENAKLKRELEDLRKGGTPKAEPQKPSQQPAKPTNRIEMAMATREGKRFIEKWKSLGVEDPDAIDSMLEMMEFMTFNATSPIAKRFQEQDFKEALSAYGGKEENKFLFSKYGKEIEDEIRKGYAPQYWNDPALIDAVSGQVLKRHMSEILQPKPVRQDSPSEGAQPAGGTKTDGVSDKELSTFAASEGLPINNDMDKATVRKLMIARKERDEEYKKMLNGGK